MESEVSLSCSQELAIFPYSEPDSSNLRLLSPPIIVCWKSIPVLFFHLRLGLLGDLLPSGLLTNALYAPSLLPPNTYYMLRPSGFYVYQLNNTSRRVQITSSPLFNFLQPPVAEIEYTALNLVCAFQITYVTFLQSLPSLDTETQFC